MAGSGRGSSRSSSKSVVSTGRSAGASAVASKSKPAAAVSSGKERTVSPRGPDPSVFALNVPFHMRAVASANGARWDPEVRSFLWRGSELPPGLVPFRALDHSFEKWTQDELRGVSFPRKPSIPLRNVVLREHQVEAVSAILRARRIRRCGFLLADDVGLGKTISAWKALSTLPDVRTVLIVCPLAVMAGWRMTIGWLGDCGKRVLIVNYDRLQKLFEVPEKPASGKKGGKARSLKGKARAGTAMAFDAIVWDESHRLKNPDAARSRFAMKLNAKAGFRLWLSATAGQNPLELCYLAPLLAQMTGSKASDLSEFEKWCESQSLGVARERFGKWVWSGSPDDTARVSRLLFGGTIPAGLRRRPEEIDGWPEINRIPVPVDLSPDKAELYDAAWREFRLSMGLGGGGRNPKGSLAAKLRFRQKSSLLRVDGTVDLILSSLESGRQVAASVAFRETLAAIGEGLDAAGVRWVGIHGDQDAAEKEAMRISFQTGEVSVALFTVEEGINLHQGEMNDVPRAEVIHDVRWSAIQMAQIEGRCHRDGKFAQMYWCYAPDTIDERIMEAMMERTRSMRSMLGDDQAAMDEIDRLLAAA
jgi:hypothetical protein